MPQWPERMQALTLRRVGAASKPSALQRRKEAVVRFESRAGFGDRQPLLDGGEVGANRRWRSGTRSGFPEIEHGSGVRKQVVQLTTWCHRRCGLEDSRSRCPWCCRCRLPGRAFGSHVFGILKSLRVGGALLDDHTSRPAVASSDAVTAPPAPEPIKPLPE